MTTLENPPEIDFDSPAHQGRLAELYRDFDAVGMTPLWTRSARPDADQPGAPGGAAPVALERALPAGRRAAPSSSRSAAAVSAGRSRWATRACPATPYATPTLWAAIQYLGAARGRAGAPAHPVRRSGSSLEGEGVWTVVDGDPVRDAPRRPAAHAGVALPRAPERPDTPMAWLDGLDIPLVSGTDQGFFEFGPDAGARHRHPGRCRSERLWGHPGLTPVSAVGPRRSSPLMAYRWAHTDAALTAQLELEDEGQPGRGRARARGRPVHQPHHRRRRADHDADARCTGCAPARAPRPARTSASSVWQVFDGRRRRSRWTASSACWSTATCSPSRRGRSSACEAADRAGPLRVLRRAGLRRSCACSAPPPERTPDAARDDPRPGRHPRPSGSDADRAVEVGPPDVGALLADRDWRRTAEAARGARARARLARPRARRPAPGQDRLRRAQLRPPHPRDGPRAPGAPDAVRQVPRGPGRARATTSCCPPPRTRWTGRPSSAVVDRRRRCATPTRQPRRRRSPGTRSSTTSRRATGSTGRCSGCRARPSRRRTPFGPELVTPDEAGSGLDLTCDVDGDRVQSADTADLVFAPAALVAYISTIVTSQPRRRDRHRHPGRRRPRPEASPVPPARIGADHGHRGPRGVPRTPASPRR